MPPLARVEWRPLGLHPGLLGSILIVAGAITIAHAVRTGATRSNRTAYFGIHPELYWGVGLVCAGFGALLAWI